MTRVSVRRTEHRLVPDDRRVIAKPYLPGEEIAGGLPSGTCDISFYCDDIHATVRDLRARGVEFTHDVEDHGYGYVTYMRVPGDFRVQLYQAKYRG